MRAKTAVPFPNDFKPRHHASALHQRHGQVPNEELEPQAVAVPSRRRRAPFVALAATLVIAALFWVLAISKSATSDPSGLIESSLLGKAAPAVRSNTLDGAVFDLAQRKGSWVVLNFFNSTCAPCRAEHPELVAFVDQQAQFGAEAAEFYTVLQYDDSVNDVKAFFLNHGGNWPIVRDDDGSIKIGRASCRERV